MINKFCDKWANYMIQMLFFSLPAHGEELSNRIDFYKDKNDNTVLKMTGFGFVNPDPDQIKVKFAGKDGRKLLCNGQPCVKQAKYVDKNS